MLLAWVSDLSTSFALIPRMGESRLDNVTADTLPFCRKV